MIESREDNYLQVFSFLTVQLHSFRILSTLMSNVGHKGQARSIFALDYDVITFSFSENDPSFGECFYYNFSRYNWRFRHPEELKPGTLRAIIKQSGLTVEEFVNLL